MPKNAKSSPTAPSTQSSLPTMELPHEAIAQLRTLFEENAELLRFPDVDADRLGELSQEVEQRREAVEQASLALADAREALVLMEQQLLDKARKGHAYATVFAADSEELQAELEGIKLAPSARAGRKRRPVARTKREEASELVSAEPAATGDGEAERLTLGLQSAKDEEEIAAE